MVDKGVVEQVAQRTKILNFYMDDSGAKHPDRKMGHKPEHGFDYFALGGVLIENSLEEEARNQYSEFCDKWEIVKPLHSSEIRAKANNFAWVGRLSKSDQNAFYEELFCLMSKMKVIGCLLYTSDAADE